MDLFEALEDTLQLDTCTCSSAAPPHYTQGHCCTAQSLRRSRCSKPSDMTTVQTALARGQETGHLLLEAPAEVGGPGAASCGGAGEGNLVTCHHLQGGIFITHAGEDIV